uniref:NXF1/2/3/5-like leucine-rich repeat domain-containing protein n=1 Tax=Podarcis muralis TaxID=64176 RepID=A0A670I3M9_PODMU
MQIGDTLEELWISYNLIEKLKGLHVMKKLKILYMSNNLVKDWAEFQRLAELPLLEDLVFVGNPLEEKYSADSQSAWVEEATKRVPKLKKLDGESWVGAGWHLADEKSKVEEESLVASATSHRNTIK